MFYIKLAKQFRQNKKGYPALQDRSVDRYVRAKFCNKQVYLKGDLCLSLVFY